jgi:propanol-preferring alcohol dehydrogenase
MNIVQVLGNERVRLIDLPVPQIEHDGDVLVRIKASAICGSEMPGYRAPTGMDTNSGHEAAGIVEAVRGCAALKPGDRVALFALASCGTCKHCRRGEHILCLNRPATSAMGWHADYAIVHERQCLPLPDDISFEVGAMLGDAVGVPYRAARRIQICGFDRVAVFGLGPMGLLAVAVCRMAGATVYGADPVARRRALAKELGAQEVLDPGQPGFIERIHDLTKGEMLSAALECAGKEEALNLALATLGVHGRLAVVGENHRAIINPSEALIRREIMVVGVWYYGTADFQDMVNLVRSGLPVEKLITHRFPLENAPEAFSAFARRETGKVILTRD